MIVGSDPRPRPATGSRPTSGGRLVTGATASCCGSSSSPGSKPARAAARLPQTERPLAQDPSSPPSSIAVTSIDRRGHSGELAAVDRQVDRGEIPGSTSSKRAGAGSPLRLAQVWKIGAPAPSERPADQPQTEPLRVLAAGERVAVLGVRDHERHGPGSRAPSASRVRGPSPRSARASRAARSRGRPRACRRRGP